MTHRCWATVIILISIAAGCGKNPAAPTPTTPIPPAPVAPLGLAGALSIASFTFTGWHDDDFHYLPVLRLEADATGGALYVRQIDFRTSDATSARSLAGVRPANPWRIAAGGSFVLPERMPGLEMVSPIALPSIAVNITVSDDAGHVATVSGEAAVPPISQDVAAAALVIRDFTVAGWYDQNQRRYHYWPKLTLAETSGVSPASIVKLAFELLDVGPAGRVPPSLGPVAVPAAGTISLVEDDYGYGPWLEIDSTADAPRVSVVIAFVDRDGRGASVSAIAPVSR